MSAMVKNFHADEALVRHGSVHLETRICDAGSVRATQDRATTSGFKSRRLLYGGELMATFAFETTFGREVLDLDYAQVEEGRLNYNRGVVKSIPLCQMDVAQVENAMTLNTFLARLPEMA